MQPFYKLRTKDRAVDMRGLNLSYTEMSIVVPAGAGDCVGINLSTILSACSLESCIRLALNWNRTLPDDMF